MKPNKSISNIKLMTLLSRKRLNLADWTRQNGIFTYSSLLERCSRMGVMPPSEEDFVATLPRIPVSSPTEGVVVLSAPSIVLESTGEVEVPEEPVEVQPELTVSAVKKSKRS